MQLVKKTQKDWECLECGCIIKEGSSMFRKHIHRWKQEIYCIACGKPEIKEGAKVWEDAVKLEPYRADENSAYQLFLNNATYYRNVLDFINNIA